MWNAIQLTMPIWQSLCKFSYQMFLHVKTTHLLILVVSNQYLFLRSSIALNGSYRKYLCRSHLLQAWTFYAKVSLEEARLFYSKCSADYLMAMLSFILLPFRMRKYEMLVCITSKNLKEYLRRTRLVPSSSYLILMALSRLIWRIKMLLLLVNTYLCSWTLTLTCIQSFQTCQLNIQLKPSWIDSSLSIFITPLQILIWNGNGIKTPRNLTR